MTNQPAEAVAQVGEKLVPDSGPTPAEREGRALAGRRFLTLGLLFLIAIATVLAAGIVTRRNHERTLVAAAHEQATSPPRVNVVTAREENTTVERVLPGSALPWIEASIYPRTTGYVQERLVDIGDRVKAGQLLAVIDAPDLDDQLAEAESSLAMAKANLPLAEANAVVAQIALDRLVRSGPGTAIPLIQIDEQRAAVKTSAAQVEVAKASIKVNEAAVGRYTELQNFERIVAPFDGVITARDVDPGDLLTADSPATTREIFHVMQTDVLRVFVSVPQTFAAEITEGQDAVVFLRDAPQKTYAGKVARTANALDAATRTLLTQVNIPNPDDALRPGMFLQVRFQFKQSTPPLLIPTNALATRAGKPRVAILDPQHRVSYREVVLGRDFGSEVEVITGLQAGDAVVVHPGDDLPEGIVVEPILPQPSQSVKN